jgi:hypothetical protein
MEHRLRLVEAERKLKLEEEGRILKLAAAEGCASQEEEVVEQLILVVVVAEPRSSLRTHMWFSLLLG